MRKMRLKSWVATIITIWAVLDVFLVVLALYMGRVLELGWV